MVLTLLFSLFALSTAYPTSLPNGTEFATDSEEVLVVGGKSYSAIFDSIELYNPNTQTTDILPVRLSVPRAKHISALIDNGEVLVAGGYTEDSSGVSSATATTEIINLEQNSVRSGPPMLEGRQTAGAAVFKGGVWVCGGSVKSGRKTETCEVFKGGRWSSVPSMLTSRSHFALVAIESRNELYALSGDGGGTMEVYTPKSGQWQYVHTAYNNFYTVEMPKWLVLFSAVQINGVIHVCGGIEFIQGKSQAVDTNSCIQYDPKKNRWEDGLSMTQRRSAFQMVTLDGNLYVFGGGGNDEWGYVALASIDCYDMKKNKWSNCGEMHESRFFHTAVVVA